MGETYGCCSVYEQHEHEAKLDKASRPIKRRKCATKCNLEFDNCCFCCCKKTHQFQNERGKLISQDPCPSGNDEDTKITEAPSQTTSAISLTDSTDIEHPESFSTKTKIETNISDHNSDDDIIDIPNRFASIPQTNSVQFLVDFQVIYSVHVPKDEYDRWTLSQRLLKRINISQDLRVPCDENESAYDYTEMKCFLLKNFEKVFGINTKEFNQFKRIILYAIEICPEIYFLSLNSSKTDRVFLGEILDVLKKRNETNRYGPEILDIENLPIKHKGLELICKYLEADIEDTKWLKIGQCFGYDIPQNIAQKIVNSSERNTHLLRMNVEFNTKLHQHSQQISQHLKKNNQIYRKKRRMTI